MTTEAASTHPVRGAAKTGDSERAVQPRSPGSRRILLTMDLIAGEGRPHGGSNRPFGYENDKVTVRESEAVVIRTIATRFLAGESLRSLAIWLDESGVRTVKGRPWKTPTIAAMLSSGRIAGLREHHGAVVSKAVWSPIISAGEREQVLAMFERRKPKARRARQHYLLSGLLRCGKCGKVLYSSARSSGRRYVCMSGPDHRGCGRLAVVAGPVEDTLVEEALRRFETLEPAQREIVLGALGDTGGSASLRSAWPDLDPAQRNACMKVMLESATVEAGRAGGEFDPGRVKPIWRL